MGYNAVQSIESHPTFWKDIASIFRSKNKPSKKPSWKYRWQVEPFSDSWLTFNGLHGAISQKTEIFITASVRMPDLTF
jgi:hypothetical protein